MNDANLRSNLAELLDSYDERRANADAAAVREILSSSSEIFIFGAGQNGRMIAAEWTDAHGKLAGFVDDTPNKQGTSVDGLPVVSKNHLGDRPGTLVISSIFSPHVGFRDIRTRFAAETKIISLFHFIRATRPSTSFYFLRDTEFLRSHVTDILWLFDRLDDRQSKEELFAHIKFRLTLEFEVLPSWKRVHWPFPLGEKPLLYVDCGAFDGDTLIPFVSAHAGHLRLALPIEPDPNNFLRLKQAVQALPKAISSRIKLVAAATGEARSTGQFNPGLGQASALSETGSVEVDVVSLDDLVGAEMCLDDQLIIKIDVEGAEAETLRGAKQLISTGRALLAISVYHNPSDLWSLPRCVSDMNGTYRFAVRSNGADGADLITYAFKTGA